VELGSGVAVGAESDPEFATFFRSGLECYFLTNNGVETEQECNFEISEFFQYFFF